MTPSPSPPPAFTSRSFQSSSGSTQPSLRSATGTPRTPLSSAIPTSSRPGPVISTELIDASAQRATVVLVYALLVGWKLYDWLQLVENDTEPTWMWLKWMLLDFAFLFGVPELRIPWLELSRPFVLTVYFGHVIFDWMLAFNVGVPWQAWLLAFVRVFFERELAIQEHNVRVSNILQNSSLIMGKQVITILPEGSAVLNPEAKPFCLGGDVKRVFVPIVFNATVPEHVELIRTDLESGKEETVSLSGKQIKEIRHHASRERAEQETALVNFDFAVTKPGAYRLGKVLDEYKLEVQRAGPQTLVVPCPKARVADTTGSADRCIGDLSDLALEVEGTPPLKIVYSRTVNGKDHSFHFQSLQPDGYQSPILAGQQSLAVTLASDQDVSWAQAQKVTVGLNESMSNAGDWQYAIDEVHDVFGNSVKYTPAAEEVDAKARSKHLLRNFIVHGRPTLRMARCDLQNPIKIPSGSSASLPVKFELPGRGAADSGYGLTWQFSPLDTLTSTGDHGSESVVKEFKARSGNDLPKVSAPGLYTLKSVSAGGCEGEVQEPSSCLLINPLQPSMTVRSEEIPDTCAGNSIGRRFDIELTGTPPFEVRYDVYENGQLDAHKFVAQGSRHQIEAIPRLAGHHKIVFKQIDDAVYKGIRLKDDDKFVFEQDVRPPARALILSTTGDQNACLGESVNVDVRLFGEAPYTLEWELVHDGKRTQHRADNIYETVYSIKTEALTKGGEYTLALTGIQDKTGCRNFLQDDVRISVRRQRPRAAFAAIDGKRSTRILEDSKVNLPVRLTGDGPWKISYRNLNESAGLVQKTLKKTNDVIDVKLPGTYEIVEVEDRQCSGTADESASTFEVDWFSRPQMDVVRTERLDEGKGGTFVKQDVCEGDIDSFELGLTGKSWTSVPRNGSRPVTDQTRCSAISR
jgi:nucleoporin POM152